MKRCKYYKECDFKMPGIQLLDALGYENVICECEYYVPEAPDIDPYWKDIIDETNRRLDEDRK